MARSADLGLLVLTCGPQHQVVRWIPPLDVSAAEIAEARRDLRRGAAGGGV